MISSELPEILRLSHRIAVMCEGRLTGILPGGASQEDALQKLQYDLFYIKNISVAMDLFILLNTVKTVLLRRGA